MKAIYKDIDDLLKEISNLYQGNRTNFIIKAILLKYLLDNDYINSIDLDKINFTFNCIVSIWAEEPVHMSKEDDIQLSSHEKDILKLYLTAGASLKEKNSHILGHIYEYLSSRKNKKQKGMFYTPIEIIDHMLSLISTEKKDFDLLDPACGGGFFLSRAYDKILGSTDRGNANVHIHKKILSHLWGFDKDPMAAFITELVLQLKYKEYIPISQTFCIDSLLDPLPNNLPKFHYIIGNPPYIGHKNLDRDTFLALKDKYANIFYDKGDISYCFFPLGMSLLKDKGELVYITSRYFLEALYATGLRDFLQNNSYIEEIIDYNGNRVIKGVEVDLAIIYLKKLKTYNPSIKVTKLKEELIDVDYKDIFTIGNENTFICYQSDLDPNGWVLISNRERNLINKILSKCQLDLNTICTAHQGVITGCDRAFVIDEENKAKFEEHLVPWIKSKNIHTFSISPSNKYLLYTDDMVMEKDTLEYEHLLAFKEKLENRRECKNGIRKWYMLQWGRDKSIFKRRKIIFPYKAEGNRFAIDEDGSFFSADIYSMAIKNSLFSDKLSLEYLVCLLNSSIYEYYFKTFAKKLGAKLYEYYPNTLMRLKIPLADSNTLSSFKKYYDKIIYWQSLGNLDKAEKVMEKIDALLFEFFKINKDEQSIIKNRLKNEES